MRTGRIARPGTARGRISVHRAPTRRPHSVGWVNFRTAAPQQPTMTATVPVQPAAPRRLLAIVGAAAAAPPAPVAPPPAPPATRSVRVHYIRKSKDYEVRAALQKNQRHLQWLSLISPTLTVGCIRVALQARDSIQALVCLILSRFAAVLRHLITAANMLVSPLLNAATWQLGWTEESMVLHLRVLQVSATLTQLRCSVQIAAFRQPRQIATYPVPCGVQCRAGACTFGARLRLRPAGSTLCHLQGAQPTCGCCKLLGAMQWHRTGLNT
jgi:hypothetical protein